MRLGLRLLLVSALAAPVGGCIRTAPGDPAPPKPAPLTDVDAFAEAHRQAARSVAASLTAHGERPQEFYAEIEAGAGGRVLIFHLWHQSAFEPDNRHVAGNPGGKCRDVHYDVARREVTATLFWQ